MKADVYNNLGYYSIRLKNYEQSVSYFKSSINIMPDYGYANDNLGYALIQLGKLEEGKEFLEKAMFDNETIANSVKKSFSSLFMFFLRVILFWFLRSCLTTSQLLFLIKISLNTCFLYVRFISSII